MLQSPLSATKHSPVLGSASKEAWTGVSHIAGGAIKELANKETTIFSKCKTGFETLPLVLLHPRYDQHVSQSEGTAT